MALLALLLELGVDLKKGAEAVTTTATAPVCPARLPPTLSELEDALSAADKPAPSTRTRRSSLNVGQPSSRSTMPGVGVCGSQEGKHHPFSTMTANANESTASPLSGKEQKSPWVAAGAESDPDDTTVIPAQARSMRPTDSTGIPLAIPRSASYSFPHRGQLVGEDFSSSNDNPELIRAFSHGDAPLTAHSLTYKRSYRSLPETTGTGAENGGVRSAPEVVSPFPAEFVPRIRSGSAIRSSARPGSGSRTVMNTKSVPAPSGQGRVSAKDFEECGHNFAALLVVRWNSLARRRERKGHNVGTSRDVDLNSGAGGANAESGFELISRLALRQPPPTRKQWWPHPFSRWVSTRLRSPEDDEGVGAPGGKWWRTRDPDTRSFYGTNRSSIAGGGMGMSYSMDGAGLESLMAENPGAPERQRAIATELLRDHFLTQVGYSTYVR